MVSSVLAQAILDQNAPDIVGAFKEGQREAREAKTRELAGKALTTGQIDPLLAEISPEIAFSIGEQIRARNARDISDFMRDAQIAKSKLDAGDTQGALQFAIQRRNAIRNRGGDTAQTDAFISTLQNNPEQARQELNAFLGSVEQAKGVVVGGRIVDPVTGRVIFEPEGGVDDTVGVQSSEILPDGTTVQVLKDGSTRVTSPIGKVLEGAERSEAIKQARQFGVEITGESAAARAGQAQLAKDRQEIRKTVFGAARQGQKTLKEVGRLKGALEAVRTGRLAAARQSLGGLIPGVRDANAEALNSAINEFVLRRKDELLGGGVLSDADIALLQGVGPQLGNTIEANLEILSRFEQVAQNDVDRGKRLRNFKGDALEFDIEQFVEDEPAQQQPQKPTQVLQFDAQGNLVQ